MRWSVPTSARQAGKWPARLLGWTCRSDAPVCSAVRKALKRRWPVGSEGLLLGTAWLELTAGPHTSSIARPLLLLGFGDTRDQWCGQLDFAFNVMHIGKVNAAVGASMEWLKINCGVVVSSR